METGQNIADVNNLKSFDARRRNNEFKSLKKEMNRGDRSFSLNEGEESESKSPKAKRSEKLMEVANKVEGMFIGMMMKRMRKTVMETKGAFDGGPGEKMFREQLDQKYSKQIAQSRRFGLAEQLYNQYANQFGVDKINTK